MIKRYPCQIAVLFIFGILVAKGMVIYQEAGTAKDGLLFTILAALLAVGTALRCICREVTRKKKLRQIVILLLAFGIGMVRMHVVTDAIEQRTVGILDGQKVVVQGRIIKKQLQVKETSDQAISWTVFLTDSYLKTSQEIRFCGDIISYVDLKSDRPVIGNTIILSGKAKLFREARNDGNFDERSYYENQGYALKIYADKDSFRVVDENTDQLGEFLYVLQQRLAQVFQTYMAQDEAGAMCAMLLGEKSMLDSEIKQLYRQSGIAHILAISGLHISILGAAVFRFFRYSGASYGAAAFVSMGLLLLFGVMTGLGLSTMRAVIMFGIYLGAACCGRAYDSRNGLAVAAVCLLLQNPRCLFLAGFQFSFLAVIGVLFGREICTVYRTKYRLMETVRMSLSIQMLTLPLTAWYYFEIPVYSILLNLIVLPFMGAVLILGLFGGVFGLLLPGGVFSKWLLSGCTLLLRYFSAAGEMILSFPGAVSVTGKSKVWQMVVYYLILTGCAFALGKQQIARREVIGRQPTVEHKHTNDQLVVSISFAVCLGLLFVRLPKHPEIVILDVGQGDGIYIRTSDGMDIMIDGGSTDVKQVGTYRILPFLKSQGIAEIDYWFLSHLDQDHVNGFKEIVESGYLVGEVIFSSSVVKDDAYEKIIGKLAEYEIPIRYLEKGDVLRGEKASFYCLSPMTDEWNEDRNAKSLVLLYEDDGCMGFFSGDISKSEEDRLLKDTNLGQVTLYKAAHHGSKYSNTERLLAQLQPAVSVVSCAKENDYGHPGEEAVYYMEKYSGSVRYTMHSGQIRILFREGKVEIKEYCHSRQQDVRS